MDDLMVARNREDLSFEAMRPEEQMIVKALENARTTGQPAMRIAELQIAAGWDEVDEHECPDGHCELCAEALRKGNSKVRNNLRRLMRFGWIHRPVDGTYALIEEHKPESTVQEMLTDLADIVHVEPPQPVAQLEPEPPQPVMRSPLVTIRKKSHGPNPTELDGEERLRIRARVMNGEMEAIEAIKRFDCTFYNACLDQAEAGSWPGFSCANCTAYALPDRHQADSDILACLALNKAHELIMKHGKVMRVRGVKPGADAKRSTDDDAEDFDDASACAMG